jgi:3-oxoacyl-(acyl-carrier-protein) synthase
MTAPRAFVVGLGASTAAGRGVPALLAALRAAARPLRRLAGLDVPDDLRLVAGEVPGLPEHPGLPRTHALALDAAREAMHGRGNPPDAVVLGVTTGGITTTEALLAEGDTDPAHYALHGAGTVAEVVARELGCTGPALTVATACSSGAVALKIALELIRSGRARSVLAGGADALSRLTYHGFQLLQLIDPQGARPLDRDRQGMTVAEGAGLLLLVAATEPPADGVAELRGGGLSCDAHHPTQPLPGGAGACTAMERALADAGLSPSSVDYVNLHGTGTKDNDAAEAAAVHALWPVPPPLSSTKGLTGHPLAAAGGVVAVIGALAIREGLLPPNVGLTEPDPALDLQPLRTATAAAPRVVVSNSFGFGGNNAALVLAHPAVPPGPASAALTDELEILGSACLSGAGDAAATLERLRLGRSAAGILPDDAVSRDLPPRLVRRLRRLPRIALALADAAGRDADPAVAPRAVFFGTAWGPLSETHEFLARLFESGGKFSSPTDFVGSVHNAPAGQIAIRCAARGPNVTTTAGEASFEQALLLAGLLAREDDEPLLVGGADEFHAAFSPRLEPVAPGTIPADGGGALLVRRPQGTGVRIRPLFGPLPHDGPELPLGLAETLQETDRLRGGIGALFVATPGPGGIVPAGLPAVPILDARALLGAYATVSAAAAVLAARFLRDGTLPAADGGAPRPAGRSIVLLSLGRRASAIELFLPGAAR